MNMLDTTSHPFPVLASEITSRDKQISDLSARLAAAKHNEAEVRKHLACRIKAADDAYARAFAAEDELEATRERERRLRELWREYFSADDVIRKSGYMDNYTDAARARDRLARVLKDARAALATPAASDAHENTPADKAGAGEE